MHTITNSILVSVPCTYNISNTDYLYIYIMECETNEQIQVAYKLVHSIATLGGKTDTKINSVRINVHLFLPITKLNKRFRLAGKRPL